METDKIESAFDILIIGAGMYVCGRGTKDFGTILPALFEWQRKNSSIRRINVCATNPDSAIECNNRVKQLSEKMDVRIDVDVYPRSGPKDQNSYKKVIEKFPALSCAIVVVPDHLHKDIVADCLNAGIPTLVVKPLTTSVKDAKELIEIQSKKNVYGAVEFHKRFDRANLKLMEVLLTQQVGDPLYFIVEYSQRKSIPSKVFSGWVDNTNIFQYLGVHYVDIIHFVTKAVPSRVMAIGQYGWLKDRGINTYDAVHATIEWEMPNKRTFVSFIFTNWVDPESTSAMSDQKIKVIGTKGRAESDQKKRGITIITDDNGIEEPNPDFCSTYISNRGNRLYKGYGIKSIHTFLKDICKLNSGLETIDSLECKRSTFKESIISTAVIESANRSLELNGEWVDIEF